MYSALCSEYKNVLTYSQPGPSVLLFYLYSYHSTICRNPDRTVGRFEPGTYKEKMYAAVARPRPGERGPLSCQTNDDLCHAGGLLL